MCCTNPVTPGKTTERPLGNRSAVLLSLWQSLVGGLSGLGFSFEVTTRMRAIAKGLVARLATAAKGHPPAFGNGVGVPVLVYQVEGAVDLVRAVSAYFDPYVSHTLLQSSLCSNSARYDQGITTAPAAGND